MVMRYIKLLQLSKFAMTAHLKQVFVGLINLLRMMLP